MRKLIKIIAFSFILLCGGQLSAQVDIRFGVGGELPVGTSSELYSFGTGLNFAIMKEIKYNLLIGVYSGATYYGYSYSLGANRFALRFPVMAGFQYHFPDVRELTSGYIGFRAGYFVDKLFFYNRSENHEIESSWGANPAICISGGISKPLKRGLIGFVEFSYDLMLYKTYENAESREKYSILCLQAGIIKQLGKKHRK